MSTYLVFIIQGWESKEDANQLHDERLLDYVEFQLIDIQAEHALERAKALLPKQHYRIKTIIEKESEWPSPKTS